MTAGSDIAGEKELIWVPKKLADEYAKYETVQEQERLVKELINRKKINIENENEHLEEQMLQFKSVCLAHRRELEKAYTEESSKVEQLFLDLGDYSKKVRDSAEKLAGQIRPLSEEIENIEKNVSSIKKQLHGLDVFAVERLVDLASKLNQMDEGTKQIMQFLLNEYKKPAVKS